MLDLRKLQLVKNVSTLGENSRSLRSAIKDAGFSQSMADHPTRITDSKWFKNALPDYGESANEIKNLLYASRVDHYVFPPMMSDDEIIELIESIAGCRVKKIKHGETQTWVWYLTPDNKSKKEALDIILKVRGDYAPLKIKSVDPTDTLTDEQLEAEIEKAKREKEERRLNG